MVVSNAAPETRGPFQTYYLWRFYAENQCRFYSRNVNVGLRSERAVGAIRADIVTAG